VFIFCLCPPCHWYLSVVFKTHHVIVNLLYKYCMVSYWLPKWPYDLNRILANILIFAVVVNWKTRTILWLHRIALYYGARQCLLLVCAQNGEPNFSNQYLFLVNQYRSYRCFKTSGLIGAPAFHLVIAWLAHHYIKNMHKDYTSLPAFSLKDLHFWSWMTSNLCTINQCCILL